MKNPKFEAQHKRDTKGRFKTKPSVQADTPQIPKINLTEGSGTAPQTPQAQTDSKVSGLNKEERESMSEKARLLLLEAQEACDFAANEMHLNRFVDAEKTLLRASELDDKARTHIDNPDVSFTGYWKDAEDAVNAALDSIFENVSTITKIEHARKAASYYGKIYNEL